jgi:hypothetical protein
MESSRFLQISPEILLEYTYTDQANPSTFNTSAYPIEIMRDGHADGTYMFNADSVISTMGNARDISAAAIDSRKTQYAYLNTDVGVPYNDFDPKLTDTINLPQTFLPNLDVEYDTVRFHFTSGFDFQDYDGLILEVLAPRRDSIMINLSSITFLKTDTPVFNPDPFLLGNKLYSTYIEWRVPALFYLVNSFSVSDSNLLSYRLTEGQGFLSTPPITIKVSGIYETLNENGYSIFNTQEINSVALTNRDIYDLLSAEVIESTSGDFFELSGQVEGSTLSNFIAQLNIEGGNYIAIHQITVSEQIGTTFTQTADQMFTQTTDFDEPIRFRPIILNSAVAVSFAINYTLRLFNRNDNTQIIKRARLVSFDTKKYGRRLMKINLGTVPTVAKVYNRVENNEGNNITIVNGNSLGNNSANTSDKITEKLVVQTKYVTSFRDRINIKAAISPVSLQNIEGDVRD